MELITWIGYIKLETIRIDMFNEIYRKESIDKYMLNVEFILVPVIFIVTLYSISIFFGVTSKLILKTTKINNFFLNVLLFGGTILHELSHIIFILIFGIKIKSFKLFTFEHSETRGFVKFEYDSSNIFHKIGLFFISIAPIVLGLFYSHVIISDLFNNYLSFQFINQLNLNWINDYLNFTTLIQVYLLISISFTLSMSTQDYKVMMKGALSSTFVLMLIISIIYLIDQSFYLSLMKNLEHFITTMLIISIVLFVVQLIFLIVILLIKKLLIFIRIIT